MNAAPFTRLTTSQVMSLFHGTKLWWGKMFFDFFLLTISNMDILVDIMLQMGFQSGHWHWSSAYSYAKELGRDILPPTFNKVWVVSWTTFGSFPSETWSRKPLQIYITAEWKNTSSCGFQMHLFLPSTKGSLFSMGWAQKVTYIIHNHDFVHTS